MTSIFLSAMRRDFGTPHKDGENQAEEAANISASLPAVSPEPKSIDFIGFGLRSLSRLIEVLARENVRGGLRLNAALTLEQLEMLEAELRNQGLLRAVSGSSFLLVPQVVHEVNMLKWRARRAGIWSERCDFLVHLPSYVAERAKRLSDSGDGAEKSAKVLAELHYLNDLASYLLAEKGEGKNRYERGMDLVLKVIAEREADLSETTGPKRIKIILPIAAKAFLAALRRAE